MKKILFMALLACMFVGCSSNGSREIQVDEIEFVSKSKLQGFDERSDYSKMKSIFEVVPGKYEISWNLVDNFPQTKQYNVALHLKLRLKRHVEVLPSVFETIQQANAQDKINQWVPFEFYLADANGKVDMRTASGLKSDHNPYGEWDENGMENRDALLDFMNFLNSAPGTEIDIVANTIGLVSSNVDCIKIIKNTRKIIFSDYVCNDKDFERKIGKIE